MWRHGTSAILLRMFSVIIPTLNRAHLILDALESVRAQDVRPIEVIVVDDGSTDSTVEVVNQWAVEHAGKDFSVELITQSHGGGNAARNAGIRASSGDEVAFLDSDDTWHPTKLRRQGEYLDAHPEYGAVYCGLEVVDLSTGAVLETPAHDFPQGKLFPEILVRDMTAPTSCYMVRRRALDLAGFFDESLQARQDWDMWIRVAKQFPVGAVAETLVQYRRHAGERTTTDPMREIHAYEAIREKYGAWLLAQSPSLQRRAKGAYHRRLGRVCLHRGISRQRALGHYLRACLCDPLAFDNYAALGGFFLPGNFRQRIHRLWNKALGRTALAIRSH